MYEPAWTQNWLWGLPLIAVTLSLHAIGTIAIAAPLIRTSNWLAARPHHRRPAAGRLLGAAVIGFVGWALAVLHGLEATLWALAYVWLGAFDSLESAMLYSLDSLTTRGESGLELHRQWRLLGALEAVNGVLAFGLSTAFLFLVTLRIWQFLQRQHSQDGMDETH